jgi:hypothetical protein
MNRRNYAEKRLTLMARMPPGVTANQLSKQKNTILR